MASTDFMVLDFSAEGTVTALHREQFDLGFLGKQKIERASDIRFDEDAQSWMIYLNAGVDPFGELAFKAIPEAGNIRTYELARKVEVEWLEQSKLDGVTPESEIGMLHLLAARLKFGV